jgi:hypothetical protein
LDLEMRSRAAAARSAELVERLIASVRLRPSLQRPDVLSLCDNRTGRFARLG